MVTNKNITEPLLSICIPTYNRAKILEQTLISITENPIFISTNKIEIVISDNKSTDNTEEICQKFVNKFSDKILYSKLETSIKADLNFIKALRLGRGKLLKLNNDNCAFYSGALEKIIKLVENYESTKEVLFFANPLPNTKNKLFICSSINEFISKVSHRVTWCSSFSIWKDDMATFDNPERCADLGFIQTDLILRQLANNKKVIVLNEHLFDVTYAANKGGYNPAIYFGNNYLIKILKPYVDSGLLDEKIYEREKKAVLKDTTLAYIFDIKKEYRFKTENWFQYLFPIYKNNLYFYFFYMQFAMKKILYTIFKPLIEKYNYFLFKAKMKFYTLTKNNEKISKYQKKLIHQNNAIGGTI